MMNTLSDKHERQHPRAILSPYQSIVYEFNEYTKSHESYFFILIYFWFDFSWYVVTNQTQHTNAQTLVYKMVCI